MTEQRCVILVLGNKVQRFATADDALVALARHDGCDDVARWRVQLGYVAALSAVLPLPLPADAGGLLALLFYCGLANWDFWN